MLHIRLLGNFYLVHKGEPITGLETARLQSLLAYLVLHRDAPQSRRHLAFLFWPDSTEAQARTNLRHLLHDLKQALPQAETFLSVEPQTLLWRTDSPFTLDVFEFEQAAAQAASIEALQEAVGLYHGELLPSCYDDWILPERERLHQKYIETLERLVTRLEEQPDYRATIRYAQRLLKADPLREETYRHLMRLHTQSSDPTGVVRIYQTCIAVLQQELGVEPSAETREMYDQCLKGQVSPSPARHISPPPVSISRSHNLPFQLTRFIGREHEKGQVEKLVKAHRLVTLTGPGGAGKTRLALAVAADLCQTFADGVWWVDLAPLADEALVVSTVASILGVFEGGGLPLVQILSDHVRDRHLLLILDNCEHVRRIAGHLAETLLQAAPNLRVLVTSRVVLGLRGELAWSLPPLSIPKLVDWQKPLDKNLTGKRPGQDPLSALLQSESVQLFLDRALTVLPTFALTSTNGPAIGQICRRLDGIPLAIELAAARVKVLSVPQIADRLDNALRLLTQGSPTALPRQQTLRATMDWSYELLSDPERILFRWLAGFASSFTFEAVEAICQCQGIEVDEVLDLLSGLVDKSLVALEQISEESRFRLHEIVRQYAQEKLSQAGEAQCVRDRHLDFFLKLAETAEPHLQGGAEQVAWLNRLELEHDNLRVALQWSLQNPAQSAEAALRLVGALWLFWFIRGHFHDGRRWVEKALEATQESDVSKLARGKALYTAGSFTIFQGDYDQGRILSEKSLVVCREAGDHFGMSVSLHHLGMIAIDRGEYIQAKELLTEGLNLARSLGNPWLISMLLTDMGSVATAQGQLEQSEIFDTEDLAVTRQANDKFGMLYALTNLAAHAMDRGDYERAKPLAEESLAISREIGEKRGVAFGLGRLGVIAHHEGRYETARELLQESLFVLRDTGDRWNILYHLFELATLAQTQGDAIRATQLLAATESLRQLIGVVIEPTTRAQYESLLTALQSQLDHTVFDLAWTRGYAMSLEQAIRYALEIPTNPVEIEVTDRQNLS